MFPLPKPANKKIRFRQDMVACCRGGEAVISYNLYRFFCAARVAENDGTFLCGNLIPADGGYYILSFDALTDEWGAAVEADRLNPESFLPIWADGFAGITAWCRSADDSRGTTLTQAFYIPGIRGSYWIIRTDFILRKIRRPHFGAVRRRVHGACPYLSRTALSQRV